MTPPPKRVLVAGDDEGPAIVAVLVPKALPADAFALFPKTYPVCLNNDGVVVLLTPIPGVEGPPPKKPL